MKISNYMNNTNSIMEKNTDKVQKGNSQTSTALMILMILISAMARKLTDRFYWYNPLAILNDEINLRRSLGIAPVIGL